MTFGAAITITHAWLLALGRPPDLVILNHDFGRQTWSPRTQRGATLTWLTRLDSFGKRTDIWRGPAVTSGSLDSLRTASVGWPCLSLQCTGCVDDTPGTPGLSKTWEGAIPLQVLWPTASADTALPVIPILPGFLANTALAACFPFAAILSWRHIRRRARAQANQCVRCGYPLALSPVCSECGTPRTDASR